jgi:hypothetical protein
MTRTKEKPTTAASFQERLLLLVRANLPKDVAGKKRRDRGLLRFAKQNPEIVVFVVLHDP